MSRVFFFSLMECFPSEYVFVFAKSAKLFTLGYVQISFFFFLFFFLHIWSRRALSRDCHVLFSTAAQSGTPATDATLILYHSPTGLKVEMLNTGPFVMVRSLFPDFFFFSSSFPLRAIIVCVRLRIGGLSRNAEERGAE